MTDAPQRSRQQATTIAALGAVVVWALGGALAPAGPGGLISNIGLTVAPLAAAACCTWRGRRHGGVLRRIWFLLAAATAAWGAGQALWTWYESVLEVAVPFPSPADVGYLSLPPLAAAALLALPLSAPSVAGRIRAVLDGLLVAGSLLLCCWVVVLRPIVSAGGDTLALVISLAYPVSDVVLITLVLHTWVRARTGGRPVPLSLPLVGAGLLAIAVADTGFTYLVTAGSYSSGSIIDPGWGLGFVLLMLAALRAIPAAAPAAAEESVDRPVGLLLSYLGVVVGLVVAAAEVVREGAGDGVLFWMLAAIVVLLVVRQALTVHENHALTLDLEVRVQARTAQLRESQDMLAHQAFTDSLTGLPNRALFRERLGDALRWTEDRSGLAVLFLDLDGFKAVNDTLGHGAGDELLVEVAARLQATVRPGDVVARFGGDEFAVLLDSLTEPADAVALARRIGAALQEPVLVLGERVHVNASIGIARPEPGPAGGEDGVDAVLRNADLAMYAAKEAGGGHAVYDPEMHRALVERVRLEDDLRRALADGQFVLDYQPLVAMRTGRITGVEALVRWRHPDRGLLPPVAFIPLAESIGVIGELGLWVLRTAAAQAMRWHREGDRAEPLAVHVNVSPRQLEGPLVEQVVEVLLETGLPATCLTLELTEGVLIEHDDRVVATLHELRALGVRVAIDDFGLGYSSLSYLHRFPLDVLKIDRSFVQRLAEGGDPALVTTILQLGRTLSLETVAEGIERSQERELFEDQGCTTGQGFHFSPPVAADRIQQLLTGQSALLPG